jgi:hypothetical protein
MRWSLEKIQERKQALNTRLHECSALPPGKRIHEYLKVLNECCSIGSASCALDGYFLVMYALAHHARFGGLKRNRIRLLLKLGHGLLKKAGIEPCQSRLGFLYQDLHHVMSLVEQSAGDHISAAWQLGLAEHYAQKTSGSEDDNFMMARAAQTGRLADGITAEAFLRSIKGSIAESPWKSRAELERLRLLRLCNAFPEAETLSRHLLCELSDPAAIKEVQWEEICRRAMKLQCVDPLVFSVRKRKPHHEPSYVLEAFLWTRVTADKKWLGIFKKAKYLARNSALKLKNLSHFFKCVEVIEDCYDTSIPISLRLERVGQMLHWLRLVNSIDKELLLLAAATRWLARVKSFSLALITLDEYRAKSLRLTQGATNDVLGFLGDLLCRPWVVRAGDSQTTDARNHNELPRTGTD